MSPAHTEQVLSTIQRDGNSDWTNARAHASCVGANFTGASLHGADLRGVSLRGADMRGALLCYASLAGADMTDARSDGAVGPYQLTEEEWEDEEKVGEGETPEPAM
jgi:hypothetical protein